MTTAVRSTARHGTMTSRCAKHPEKTQYTTAEAAFEALKRQENHNPELKLSVYTCDTCGYFHLSKKFGTEAIGRKNVLRADGTIYETGPAKIAAPVRDQTILKESERKATNRAQLKAVREAYQAEERARRLAEVRALVLGKPAVYLGDLVAETGHEPSTLQIQLKRLSWRHAPGTRHAIWVAPRIPDDAPAVVDLIATRDQVVKEKRQQVTAAKRAEKEAAAALQATRDAAEAADLNATLARPTLEVVEPFVAPLRTIHPPTTPDPRPVAPRSPSVPAVAVFRHTVNVDDVATMTIGDLAAAYAAAGLTLEIVVSAR